MIIEIAEHARMSERGSSLLRLIQNNETPLLDLLVREAVQNSLDAALEGEGFVNVDFEIKDFEPTCLNSELEGITESLNKRFDGQKGKLLAIRDSNTTGLTGPMTYSDVKNNVFGNLLKLIYEISMPQIQEGSGGSWGLGKTVYFRMGIGLVIYYSRIINDEGTYASRLAACLVEDENRDDALILTNDETLRRGIAWWGQSDGNGKTMPLTNQVEIERILDFLNIQPYSENETGTTVIIPYIDEFVLLEGILPSINNGDTNIFSSVWWISNIQEYLKVSIQRWYAPRLMNDKYRYGRWLRSKINGEGISGDMILPLFKSIQALYNATPISADCNSPTNDTFDISIERIALRNVFEADTTAGYIAFTKLGREALKMHYPYNYSSPYLYINAFNYDQKENQPIILYTRKPGMVVGYETSGDWTEGLPKTTGDEFILGLFVANSTNMLKHTNAKMPLEEYLRKSELADHSSWNDGSFGDYRPNIVSKIRGQLKKKMLEKFGSNGTNIEAKRNFGLRKALADEFLPPEGFGIRSSSSNPDKRGGSTNAGNVSRGFNLQIIGEPTRVHNSVQLNFEITCGKKEQDFIIQLCIKTESSLIFADSWESDEGVGKAFPINIDRFEILKYHTGRQSPPFIPKLLALDDDRHTITDNGISLDMTMSHKYKVPYSVLIHIPQKSGYTLQGRICISCKDARVQPAISMVLPKGD